MSLAVLVQTLARGSLSFVESCPLERSHFDLGGKGTAYLFPLSWTEFCFRRERWGPIETLL